MLEDLKDWIENTGTRIRSYGVPANILLKLSHPQHPAGGHVLDFDGEHVIGQFIVWPNGSVEASLVVVETATQAYFKEGVVKDVLELSCALEDLCREMVKVEGGR